MADYTLNMTAGVTPVSQDIYDLHMTIFWICVAIGVVVFSVMFYAMFYHRKSRGVEPARFHEHLWVEIAWTIIPCFILVAMAIPATRVLVHMNDVAKPDVTIKITGYQWKWRYEYLEQGINFFSNIVMTPKNENYLRTVDKPLVVPIHKKIRFLVTANDVIHSWWVPDLGVKRDAIPGFINESWARINRAGTYHGQCAELCGMHHAYMPIVVVAMAETDFNNWVLAQKGLPVPGMPQPVVGGTVAAGPPAAPKQYTMQELMQQGEKVFLSTCAVCHQATGLGLPPTFPALKGSKTATGPKDQHIATVLNGRPGTAMQAFKEQLSDDDLAAVITYERNAWGNNMKDMVQPAEIQKAKGGK